MMEAILPTIACSGSAAERLSALVRAEAALFAVSEQGSSYSDGLHGLSRAEAEVFDITLSDWPYIWAIGSACEGILRNAECLESSVASVDAGEIEALIAAFRHENSSTPHDASDWLYCERNFMRIAELINLPRRWAHVAYLKIFCWEMRGGLVVYRDED